MSNPRKKLVQPPLTLGEVAPLRHLNNQLSITLQGQGGLGQRARSECLTNTALPLEKH